MKTPFGQECKYFYGNYFRGKHDEVCRLIEANPASAAWNPALCKTCPVPKYLIANACPNLVYRGKISKSFFGLFRKIEIQAGCREHRLEVKHPPLGCGHCQTPKSHPSE